MFDDHIDSREIAEIMIDQYKNLYCPMHANRNTVSGAWINGGFTKKNINPLVVDTFLRDKKNVGQLNSNYSDGEILNPKMIEFALSSPERSSFVGSYLYPLI